MFGTLVFSKTIVKKTNIRVAYNKAEKYDELPMVDRQIIALYEDHLSF